MSVLSVTASPGLLPCCVAFTAAGKPYITSVYPTEGWTSGGARVCIVGMNFFDGIEVVFGTLQASAEVRIQTQTGNGPR